MKIEDILVGIERSHRCAIIACRQNGAVTNQFPHVWNQSDIKPFKSKNQPANIPYCAKYNKFWFIRLLHVWDDQEEIFFYEKIVKNSFGLGVMRWQSESMRKELIDIIK